MSNAAVGALFSHIVDEVINSSRVDFEENAVDENVLQELKKVWQSRLTAYNIAQFPWDPKPEQTPTPAALAAAQAAPQPSPALSNNYTQSTLSPQAAAQPLPLPSAYPANGNGSLPKPEPGLQNDPVVKQEPGANMAPVHPSFPGGSGTAAQRAAYNLENQYGPRAAASINAIHSGLVSQGSPAPQQAQQPMNQQQYRQAMAAQTHQQQQQQQHQQQRPANLHQAQVDGAAGEAASSENAPMERSTIDSLLHTQLAARAKELEGGGLLLALREATKTPGVKSKRQAGPKDGPAQVDGGEDDGEVQDDSDAINSALDDDSNQEEEDDEEEANQYTMLCMYDKVQRVKNKWKCVLKDGILNVNGKEYVFHKANGEYEW